MLSRVKLVSEIRKRLKEDYDMDIKKDIISKIIGEEEDIVMETIAVMDSIHYTWGEIYGTISEPKKLVGFTSEHLNPLKNFGYSAWKLGVPKVKWSIAALTCEKRSPAEFFELEDQRYTTAARKFRKDAGLPELREFTNLSEEKIQGINQKADAINFNKLTKRQQYKKLKDQKTNALKVRGTHKIWEEENYIPYKPSDTWTGDSQDSIDRGLINFKKHEQDEEYTVPMLFNHIWYLKDFTEISNRNSKHPEVFAIYEEYKKKMEDGKYTPLPHYDINSEKQSSRMQQEYISVINFSNGNHVDVADRRRIKLDEISKEQKELLEALGYIEISNEDYENVFGEKETNIEEKEKEEKEK